MLNRLLVTGVDDGVPPAPQARLKQNAPNPFNPDTKIRFDLTTAMKVRLAIHDVQGRLVATLVNGWLPAGDHQVSWTGRGRDNRAIASGVYFYSLEGEHLRLSRRMVLLK